MAHASFSLVKRPNCQRLHIDAFRPPEVYPAKYVFRKARKKITGIQLRRKSDGRKTSPTTSTK
jgi:hypothetical protein